jgi:hypothetical protein
MRMKMISPSNVAVDIGQTLKPHEYIGMVRREVLDAYLQDRAQASSAEIINGLFLKMDMPRDRESPYVLHYTELRQKGRRGWGEADLGGGRCGSSMPATCFKTHTSLSLSLCFSSSLSLSLHSVTKIKTPMP